MKLVRGKTLIDVMRTVSSSVLIAGFLIHVVDAYEIPPRRIEIMPYLNLMSPHNLVEDWRGESIVKNHPGLGIGAKIHSQVYKGFGFLIDFSFTDLEVTDSSLSTANIFTGGGYYCNKTGIGDFTVNVGYGVISVADYARALFMPGLEYSRRISQRANISVGADWIIPNDLFYEESYDTDYGTFSFFMGCGIVF
jgi:hypothetical protein